MDISRELLDYSTLEESYILDPQRSIQNPRRLFDTTTTTNGDNDQEEEEEEEDVSMTRLMNESFEVEYIKDNPGLLLQRQGQERGTNDKKKISSARSHHQQARGKLQSFLCIAPELTTVTTSSTEASLLHYENHYSPPKQSRARRRVTPPITPSSPNVATFYGHWGSRRERHISTLPSSNAGQPIRLRVTESGGLLHQHQQHHLTSSSRIGHSYSSHTYNSVSSPGIDLFSYDPYFSSGKYIIALPNGKPYGNGLVMKMGCQFMILEDARGCVLAVIKSRHTHIPSTVVYAPKARFAGQVPSGHRLTRQLVKGGKKSISVVIDGDNEMEVSAALYPWALIAKDGRTMSDDCTVHLVNDDVGSNNNGPLGGPMRRANASSNGLFNSKPNFRGRHAFDRELHTHTVVSRTGGDNSNNDGNVNSISSKSHRKSSSLEENDSDVPCCVIVRDPTNMDAADVTIAPGIDPLLMICYLASHAKMDVEPIMSGY